MFWLGNLLCEGNHDSRLGIVPKLNVSTCINQQPPFMYVQFGHREEFEDSRCAFAP